ncbi:hypothetical protein FOPG_17675 [Fusarium oxysporum f. sp. conglutinans race 2 54008]|uniref:Uncharacterized protein n=1 Tax=Fusarium oxysporum f. sp. conglutinans race 2 54008 TaxID=1089457 RepID=X0GR69_FUSOX|nr:hypothetical protein FOPG_17675 [Fusarium oxysporum f. sp. conglutinans race 2 54008]
MPQNTNKMYLGQIRFHYSSHNTPLPLDNSLQTNAEGCMHKRVVIDLTGDET